MDAEHSQDRWASWFATRRHGGDDAQLERTLAQLAPVRDRVIANAAIEPGGRVLDVGCGDGLIAFGALDAVGPDGSVIFSDLSADLLQRCRDLVADAALPGNVEFVQAAAADLSEIPDRTIDAVTVRSVLIYEPDKPAAFGEFHRVLRGGGRLSMFEPINRFHLTGPTDRFLGYDVTEVREPAAAVRAVFDAIQPAHTDPMLNFDERDLITMAEDAGFSELHLHLQVDIEPHRPMAWTTLLNSSGNPTIPTLAEAMDTALTPEQITDLSNHLRPQVESGAGQQRMAVAYLTAVA